MNRHQKKALSLAAAIANLSFSIAVAGVATYAWYSAQASKYENITDISVSTAIPDSQITWEILTYSDDEKAGVTSNETDDYYLRPYDSVITKDNIHSNAILRATLELGSFTSSNDLAIDISCVDNSEHDPTTSSVPKYTSNVCQFKSTVYSYVDSGDTEHVLNTAITPTSADTRYQTATSFFAGNKTPGTRFVSLHNSVPNKRKNKITLCPVLECGEDTVKSVTVYVECSYNKKLVEYFQSKNSAGGTINLAGDITSFEFRSTTARDGAYVKVTSGTPLTANGDYLAIYEGYKATDDLCPALDGSGTSSGAYTTGKNYVDVYSRKNMVRNTEVTEASSFSYNTSTNLLTSNAGYKIGLEASSSDSTNMLASKTGTYTNSLSYTSDHARATSVNKNTKYLQWNTNSNGQRFGYYAGTMADIDLYKLDEEADATIVAEDLILQAGYKTVYYVGDAFSSPTVFAELSDGNTVEVTGDCVFTGFSSAAAGGPFTIHITYTDEEDGITLTGEYNYTVSEVAVVSIAVTTNPSKMNYHEGETFDPTGMVVTATMNNGTTPTVDNNNLTYKTTALTLADTPFQISYGGKSTSLAITITYAPVYTYDLVTSSDTAIAAGDELILVYSSGDTHKTMTGSVTSTYFMAQTNAAVSANLSTLTYSASYQVWTVETSAFNGSRFQLNDGSDHYLRSDYYSSTYELYKTTTPNNYYASWSFTLGASSSNMNTVNNTYSYYVSYDTSNNRFTTAGSSQSTIYIYRKTAHAPLTSISTSNETTSYYTGDSFEMPTVTAHYADSSSKTVTPTSISGNDTSTAGTKTVTISYTETYIGSTVTKTADYQITVVDPTLTSIAVSGYTTSFDVGDAFSFGGTVTASYNHGPTKNVTASTTFSGYNMSAAGTYTVTASYTEGNVTKTATYQITVEDLPSKTLSSISLSGQTTSLNKGNSFSFGGTVTAHYSDSTTANVTASATFSGYNMGKLGIYTVTASYTEGGVTKTATYNLKVAGTASASSDGSHMVNADDSVNWSTSGTGTYADGSIKFDSAGDNISCNNLFTAGVSSLTVVINGKINGTDSAQNAFKVIGIDSSGNEISAAYYTFTGSYGTSYGNKTFTISSSLANITGLKVIYLTKKSGNWGVKTITWTITYS